jgi:ATP-dependent Lon protease
MRGVRRLSTITVVVAGWLVLTGTVRALEDELAWSQEEVAKVAAQFEEAVTGLNSRAKMGRDVQATLTQDARDYLLQEDLKTLQRYAGTLARRLEAGQDREQTAPLFERVEAIVQRAAVKNRAASLLENAQDDIDKARDVLNQLRRYYGKPTVPPVATEPPAGTAKE